MLKCRATKAMAISPAAVCPSGSRRRWSAEEIFVATIDARLIAIDLATGKPVLTFGDNGEVNLRSGLRIAPRGFADYEETSPPAVVGNTVIVGSGIADNGATDPASGEVRGYDAVTGKLKWTWDPIPQDAGAPGADTWKNGSAQRTGAGNAWSVIASRPATQPHFCADGQRQPGLLRRRTVGRQSLREFSGRAERIDRQAGVAFPDPFITISGTTMSPRRRFCLTCAEMGATSPRLELAPRTVITLCWIAARESRFSASRSGRFHRPM